MAKYNKKDFFSNEGTAYQRDIPILTAIANELAESNRLKRLALKVQISIGHNAQPSIPTSDLDDKA